MRILRAILPLVITVIVGYLLNTPIAGIPAFGKLLDPVSGFWANAEAADKSFDIDGSIEGLTVNADVWFDDRLVPHIKAGNDHDLYFLQGYIHAYFRLWQMDLQTRAAGGRVSELLGEKALNFDRTQRRKGMVSGAQERLKMMEADPRTKLSLDAYTEGVNAYIASLKYSGYAVEYKLMGFAPEPWTNLRTALLLMYMSDDLTGEVDDISLTSLRSILSPEEIEFFYPEKNIGSTPVIPVGTVYEQPSLKQPAAPTDPFVDFEDLNIKARPEENGKGSNNWVVSGTRTVSGRPILCDDPHLGLNLPSLWYEVQMEAPGINVYGVSLPGAPGVVIGFNNKISWGFTNNYRDVKDYYAIEQLDNDHYNFNSASTEFRKRVEVIRIKGKPDFTDTVNYTVHGPVMYDKNFEQPDGISKPLAVKWMAHLPSNELLSLYLLNRANDYTQFVHAIGYFHCPAQNFIYADTKGNIALWGQGQFINKWNGQGKYIMKGTDSSTLWGSMIPVIENPHAYNPEQGYLSSANQTVTDNAYPYWYNGTFKEYRGWRINEVLDTLSSVTVNDMFALQNDVHSVLARSVTTTLLNILDSSGTTSDEYIAMLRNWNYNLDIESEAATVFQVWWFNFYKNIWAARFGTRPAPMLPLPERTMQFLLTDRAQLPDLDKYVVNSYKDAVDSLNVLKRDNKLQWYKVKNTSVNHLAKLAPFSFTELKTGGWGNTVNAMKGNHGPSWRMVVEMKDKPEGYGIYPGGQSGNPGSKYYATFLDNWVEGKYNKLLFVDAGTNNKPNEIQYTWKLNPAKK